MRIRHLVLASLAAVLLLPALAGAQAPIASGSSNEEGVTLDVTHLERKGSVLTIKWAVRNSGSKQATVQYALTGDKPTSYIVDEESGTKYFALTDKEGQVLATEHEYTGSSFGISEYLEAGATKRFWAKFPAPPAAVKTLTLIFTNTEPLEDVPITDKQ
jgi:hypothetical protein